ncbi:MAG: glutaredoxin, partial [Vulcanococcus sp.]
MDSSLKQRLDQLVGSSPIFVFMKGSKLMPQCGFSNNVVQIL